MFTSTVRAKVLLMSNSRVSRLLRWLSTRWIISSWLEERVSLDMLDEHVQLLIVQSE